MSKYGLRIRNTLLPNSWDPSWTQRRTGTVLNQKPSAWKDIDTSTPPVPLRAPFGEGNSGWTNPTTTHTVPINSNSGGALAILTSNLKRNILILQNNSNATATGDVPPTFFFGFGQIATVNQSIALPPGVGIVLDIVCPRDAIYLTIGPFTNTGASVTIFGVAVEGALTTS